MLNFYTFIFTLLFLISTPVFNTIFLAYIIFTKETKAYKVKGPRLLTVIYLVLVALINYNAKGLYYHMRYRFIESFEYHLALITCLWGTGVSTGYYISSKIRLVQIIILGVTLVIPAAAIHLALVTLVKSIRLRVGLFTILQFFAFMLQSSMIIMFFADHIGKQRINNADQESGRKPV